MSTFSGFSKHEKKGQVDRKKKNNDNEHCIFNGTVHPPRRPKSCATFFDSSPTISFPIRFYYPMPFDPLTLVFPFFAPLNCHAHTNKQHVFGSFQRPSSAVP